MHTRVRDVVPRPTRPHGHCQLGVTRIICAIILDNRRHCLVVNEENLHTMPLVMVHGFPSALRSLFLSQGRRTNACPTGRCEGAKEKVARKKTRNCRKGDRRDYHLTTSMYPVHYQYPLYSPYRRNTGRCINNSEIGRIK